MRILYAIGRRGGAGLVQRALELAGTNPDLVLLHVADQGPRRDLEHLTGPLRRGPLGDPARIREMEAAEDTAGRDVLAEALSEAQQLGIAATTRFERGRAEQVIVAVAQEVNAELVVIRAHERPENHPAQGPASVGHTARFVVDHAPCDALLVRIMPD
jgi:nucleotide-binding universal stress UspA family protein